MSFALERQQMVSAQRDEGGAHQNQLVVVLFVGKGDELERPGVQHLAIHLCYPTRSFQRLLIGSSTPRESSSSLTAVSVRPASDVWVGIDTM
jgi:hypothetical protein